MIDLGVVTASLSPAAGGLYFSMRQLAALDPSNVKVTVYGLIDDQFENARWPDAIPVKSFARRWPHSFGRAPDLLQALLAARHDIVHLHGLWLYPSYAVDKWRRATRKPTVISSHGMLDPWALGNSSSKKRIALTAFEGRNMRAAGAFHALNTAEAKAIRSLGFTNPIGVIANGVDLPPLNDRHATTARHDARSQLLFMGRLHPKKGIDRLIDAWRIAKQRAPDVINSWRVVIAGWDDGGHRAALESLVSSADLEADIAFVGPLIGESKNAALDNASAFILPSLSEGLPMAVLEAWAHGLPVLMTGACNLPEGFAAGAAFEISAEADVMADQIVAALGDHRALALAGKAGRALVAEKFTWPEATTRMLRLYQWLLGRCAKPDFVA